MSAGIKQATSGQEAQIQIKSKTSGKQAWRGRCREIAIFGQTRERQTTERQTAENTE